MKDNSVISGSPARQAAAALLTSGLLVATLPLVLQVSCTGKNDAYEDPSLLRPDFAVGPMFDLATADDLARSRDAAAPEDMPLRWDARPPVDMASNVDAGPWDARPPEDMSKPGPVVTGLPRCTDRGVTADIVFNQVAKGSCVDRRCHSFSSGATLKSAFVGVASAQTRLFPIVTPSDIDRSYLMYKLTGQQASAMGGGGIMPRSGRLRDADLCKFIVWIKEGAK